MNFYHGPITCIDHISKKIGKCTAILSRIRHFTNINSLKLIYYALVYPYLIYGNLVWGNAYKFKKLVNIQKKIVRLMVNHYDFVALHSMWIIFLKG